MDIVKGMVVISKAGRDKGYPLAVTGFDGRFVLVADGKERPLARPKKKNPLHLAATGRTVPVDGVSDRALRRSLREAVQGEKKPDDEDAE